MRTYKLAVGHRDRVAPGAIVGALTHEGGLTGSQIGAIDIRPTFTLVGLPEHLPAGTLDKLSDTRINGAPIRIQEDRGPGGGRDGGRFRDRGERSERGPRGGRGGHREGGYRDGGSRDGGRPRWGGSEQERPRRKGYPKGKGGFAGR